MWRCISMFGLQYVAMYQYVRIAVCGDVSVCSDYSMWRCISMFGLQYVAMSVWSDYSMWRCVSMVGLQYVAMFQYVRITVCGDVSVCSDYSMWRCISMFGLQYVAMYQYVRIQYVAMYQYVRITVCNLSVCLPVRPSARVEKLGSHWTDFHEILYLNIFEIFREN